MSVIFVQTSKPAQTASDTFIPIPDLTLTLPQGSGDQALVILNVPTAYAAGKGAVGQTGGRFGISVDGVVLPTYAEFIYYSYPPTNQPGPVPVTLIDVRIPVTLVLAIPLTAKLQKIEGLYLAMRGSAIRTGSSPASLSASSI